MDINSLTVLFTSLAGRYAKALFLEGKKLACLDDISQNFLTLEAFFAKNQSLRKILTSYSLNQNDLDNGWLALGEHLSFCSAFTSFMRQLIKNKRYNIINRVKYIFHVALAKYRNKRNAIVSSVVELLPEQRKAIETLLSKMFKEKTTITYKINERLLGGIKIASEELMIDASVASQLRQLARYLKELKIEVAHEN